MVSAPAPLPTPARHAGEALLWDVTESAACAKIRMCLHLKGLPYRRVTVTLARLLATRRPGPRAGVPVLVHAGRTLADSSAIVRYLEDEVPGPPLGPSDADARAYCDLLESWADEALAPLVEACRWLDPANRRATLARMVPEIAGGVPHWLVAPAVALRMRRRLRAAGYAPAMHAVAAARLRARLATLGGLLGEREFLLGRRPTRADVAAFAQLAGLRRCAERSLLADEPAVASWIARMEAVPALGAAL